MHESQRDRAILGAVTELDFVSVQDLIDRLQASEATIRRDLKRLSEAGRLRRVRGGARPIERPRLTGQPGFEADRKRESAAKLAIARRAAAYCEPGDPVILDGGTTVFAMAQFLGGLGLKVLTNSFALARELDVSTNCHVTIPGGEIYREQQVIVSPYPQPIVRSFAARTMFLSAQAVGPQGLMQSDSILIQSEIELLERAERIVALVDSTKFEHRGVLVSCPLDRIDVLISDHRLAPRHCEMIVAAGIELVVVEAL